MEQLGRKPRICTKLSIEILGRTRQKKKERIGIRKKTVPDIRGRTQHLTIIITRNTTSKTFVRVIGPNFLRASPKINHIVLIICFYTRTDSAPLELNRSERNDCPQKCNPCCTFFFFPHFYIPASGQAVVTGVVPCSPPVLAFNFYRAQGSAIPPLLVDFSSSVANSRSSCAFRTSICAQERVPTNIYSSMHSGGFELTK